jgi:hypothetical protein
VKLQSWSVIKKAATDTPTRSTYSMWFVLCPDREKIFPIKAATLVDLFNLSNDDVSEIPMRSFAWCAARQSR